MSLRRPGIYYTQQIQYPPLQAQLQAAVPALVGYTEMAKDGDENSLHLVPTKIDSIEAFHDWFGFGYNPNFTVVVNSANAIVSIDADRRFFLYDSLRLFFENGGREIYIVSTGIYKDKIQVPTPDLPELQAGVDRLAYYDEPDLLFCPDAVNLSHGELGKFQDHCLLHCREEKFRFSIFDLKPIKSPLDTVDTFRKNLGKDNLDRGAAYHPWIHTGLEMEVGIKKIEFKQESSDPNLLASGSGPGKNLSNLTGGISLSETPVQVEVTPKDDFQIRPLPIVEEKEIRERPMPLVEPKDEEIEEIRERNLREEETEELRERHLRGEEPTEETREEIRKRPLPEVEPINEATEEIRKRPLPEVEPNDEEAEEVKERMLLEEEAEEIRKGNLHDEDEPTEDEGASKPKTLSAKTEKPRKIEGIVPPKVTSEPAKDEPTPVIPRSMPLLDWPELIANQILISPKKGLSKKNFPPVEKHVEKLTKQLLDSNYQEVEKNFLSYMGFIRSLATAFGKLAELGPVPLVIEEKLLELRNNKEIQQALNTILGLEQHRTITALQSTSAKYIAKVYGSMVGSRNWIPKWPKASDQRFPISLLDPEKLKTAPEVIGKVRFPTAISAIYGLTNMGSWQNAAKTLIGAYSQIFQLVGSPVSAGPVFFNPAPEVIAEAIEEAKRLLQYLPPSGAVSGLVASTDRQRGTYKAPANQSLIQVIEPGEYLNHYEQEHYNVHFTGKSVNALISVVGRGVVVHGSRTLQGNDPAWRYVPVRRYYLAIEKALKRVIQAYVFEPNNAQTWDMISGQLGLFLEEQRKAGALRGNNAAEAWAVRVGAGTTMTEDDILNGKLIVEISLAVARPAEFIVLTLTQQQENN